MTIDSFCEKCGGEMALFRKQGVIETFKCSSCDHMYVTKIFYDDGEEAFSSPDNKFIFVGLDESFFGRKALFLIKKIFAGMSNFYFSDLESAVNSGAKSINLGIYSKREQDEILSRAGEYKKYFHMEDVDI